MEQKAEMNNKDDAPLMAWLVRWSAEFLSKYSRGDDGQSPCERIRGEPSKVPLVPFGEKVFYLPMKIVKRSKGMPAKKPGIWLGINERTEENLIGTANGVIKCRTVIRLSETDAWDRVLLSQMRGVPWNPVPGKDDIRIPVDITEEGAVVCEDDEVPSEKSDDEVDEEQNTTLRGGPHRLHVSREAIAMYGATDGCAACTALKRLGHARGKPNYNHSAQCRERILQHMKADPQYGNLMEKHGIDVEVANLELVSEIQRGEMLVHVRKAIHHIDQTSGRQRSDTERTIDKAMMEQLITNMHVAEIYNPPRVTAMARSMGMRAGWSLDLTTQDSDGRRWDFNELEMRNRAIRKIAKDQPLFLIGSPMCTAFSCMNRISYVKMPKEEVEARMAHGRRHLEVCAKLYATQWRSGRYFLHEHPAESSSWQEDCIVKVSQRHGVLRVVGDQCRYELTSNDGQRIGPARKRAGFMTNSVCLAKELEKRCPNRNGEEVHCHVRLENGRTSKAHEYPMGLCKAICRGIMEQVEADRRGELLIANIDQGNMASSQQLREAQTELQKQQKIVEEDGEALNM